jgi:hypothetical protein
MKPTARFLNQPKSFWANVRTISQQNGYTIRGKKQVKVPTFAEMRSALHSVSLTSHHICDSQGKPTEFGETLRAYFQHRADVLNKDVELRLMNAEQALAEFQALQRANPHAKCPIPMNKQKGAKRAPAFLTAMINMIVEANSEGLECDYDPRVLTTVVLPRF